MALRMMTSKRNSQYPLKMNDNGHDIALNVTKPPILAAFIFFFPIGKLMR